MRFKPFHPEWLQVTGTRFPFFPYLSGFHLLPMESSPLHFLTIVVLKEYYLFPEDSILYIVNLRTSEIHLFYNLQLFYWHFLEILWIFIFLVFYNYSLLFHSSFGTIGIISRTISFQNLIVWRRENIGNFITPLLIQEIPGNDIFQGLHSRT